LSINSEEYIDLNHCIKLGVQALREIYQPHGFNIGANLDKAAGAGIPDHVHYHIIRDIKVTLISFHLLLRQKSFQKALISGYNKFREYFEKNLSFLRIRGNLETWI